MAKNGMATAISEPTNGAADIISLEEPYRVAFRIEGLAPILLHAWNAEAVDEKAAIAKGSKGKKSDNLETYVYRDSNDHICVKGISIARAIATMARFRQDPRSPRKSAHDLYTAGVVAEEPLLPFLPKTKTWQYTDKQRAVVQKNAINRTRPAMKAGWVIEGVLMVLLPEYISVADVNDLLVKAGRLGGLGDYRPSYGRFRVVRCDRIKADR